MVESSKVNEKQQTQNQVQGELNFEDKVIQKIIAHSIENVDGLLDVSGSLFSNIAGKVVNSDNKTSGISVEIGKKQVAFDMSIIVEYGKNISKIYDSIKKISADHILESTNLELVEVNVTVVDIKTLEEHQKDSVSLQDRLSGAGEAVQNQVGNMKKNAETPARVE
ncbi:Asp23/Gls24 family envelope stress response protein [Apilactobacillus kunkeei]|uniref:Asp23/Gls24 family envelope stress response protein n=1 Tax=Apilactobacillus kunkeei TaxID=148814 RepID=UPI001C89C8B9|nr:Asp23/Gls24 family envelope stress response protein [Apilactobacillus kunkeei]MBX8456259.1 Asp23/Gls24 family envelope stress response protein [Apilactobacillus kunkeei]